MSWDVISVDDHVIEPPDTWTSRVPRRYRDRCPRVVARGADGVVWDFDGRTRQLSGLMCLVDQPPETWQRAVVRFDDLHPGCSDPVARIADMDRAGVAASLCFPTMPGFGATYLNDQPDRDLALACIRAYDDFILDEWCGAAPGRLIPAVVIPHWDPALAAAELATLAERGARAVVFSERPHQQGFPSVFDPDRYWDPVFAAVEALGLVLCCHVGSSSHVDVPGDADYLTHNAALWLNAPHALAEYVFSGTFDRFPALKLALSEASIGWLPYGLQVMDHYYEGQRAYTGSTLQRQPSEYLGTNVFGCFIDDGVGAAAIEQLGVDAVMVEVDYPHADSIWPRVREVVDQQLAHLSPADQRKVRRDNAARLFRFEPSGVGHR